MPLNLPFPAGTVMVCLMVKAPKRIIFQGVHPRIGAFDDVPQRDHTGFFPQLETLQTMPI